MDTAAGSPPCPSPHHIQSRKMQKRSAHVSCSVVDCQNQHVNVFSLPRTDQTIRDQWIKFIFNDAVLTTLSTGLTLGVCAKHFTQGSFTNLGQYQAKLASKLHLEKGAIPTIRDLPEIETVRLCFYCSTVCNKQQLTANAAILC